MSGITADTISNMAQGEVNSLLIDWGENTPGQETGVLKASDTVVSCTVAVDSKPVGAADPTFGSVTVNSGALYVNLRSCSAGEATTVNVTMGASQTYGPYRFKFVATTTNGKVIPRYVRVNVQAPN